MALDLALGANGIEQTSDSVLRQTLNCRKSTEMTRHYPISLSNGLDPANLSASDGLDCRLTLACNNDSTLSALCSETGGGRDSEHGGGKKAKVDRPKPNFIFRLSS